MLGTLMRFCRFRTVRGLTMIELLAVVAVVAVLMTVAAPALTQWIATQRLRSINAELMSNLQYARSTAISRRVNINLRFQRTATMSCYVLYVTAAGPQCDCSRTVGDACPLGTNKEEIRTTQVMASTDVQIATLVPTALIFTKDGFLSANSTYTLTTSRISGAPGQYLVAVNAMGRPTACYSADSGTPSC